MTQHMPHDGDDAPHVHDANGAAVPPPPTPSPNTAPSPNSLGLPQEMVQSGMSEFLARQLGMTFMEQARSQTELDPVEYLSGKVAYMSLRLAEAHSIIQILTTQLHVHRTAHPESFPTFTEPGGCADCPPPPEMDTFPDPDRPA